MSVFCEMCHKEHDGSYGSGRFCSQACARAFSTFKKREIINEKLRNSNRKNNIQLCKGCQTPLFRHQRNKTGYCKKCLQLSKECKELRSFIGKHASSFVTKHRPKENSVYLSTYQPNKNDMNYVYRVHNDEEINKWQQYLQTLVLDIPNYKRRQSQTYYILQEHCVKHTKGTHFIFEHDFLMNIVLNGKLQKPNTVHHIDNNGLNNDLQNLLVFESNADHVRFHKSKFAFLTYNENTHLFSCKKLVDKTT